MYLELIDDILIIDHSKCHRSGHPHGNPGLIIIDDISLPLPQMQAPDIRGRIIEQVLDLAAASGVDDVHLIAALALHRRMTEAELRHAVGDRVYDAFAPNGQLYNFDAEDPEGLTHLGETDHGEEVVISKRAVESDLIVYVNINLVSMDGGHKSVATGLSGYAALRHHHNVHTMRHSKSFMDQEKSELHTKNWRQGRLIQEAGIKIFQIETTLNNDTFPSPWDFLQKRVLVDSIIPYIAIPKVILGIFRPMGHL